MPAAPAAELAFFLVARHLRPMTEMVVELGDDLANTDPGLPGANTAYALVFHCAGMVEWWTRHAVLGLEVARDRDAEFRARGTVEELAARVDAVCTRLVGDLAQMDLDAPLRGQPSPDYDGTPIAASARGALLHVLEELAQHHGHLEITRDVLRQRAGAPAGSPPASRSR